MTTQAERRPRGPVPPRLPARYRPLRLLASGTTATVWCAEDTLLGRRVAVKVLTAPYTSDDLALRRFRREARAAARLSNHPHVVTIYDIGEALAGDGSRRPFLVLEHLAGGTVADALRCGEVTLDDAVRWLHEAATAIDYAHHNGILHRDIKPGNLLLDCGRRLYVADFGIAQIGCEDPVTRTGQVLGTASYLAPERALGQPATAASDLYSLAVTAFELLTATRPFNAESYLARARQHLEEEPPPASGRNPRLPAALDPVLARGMAKVPERRWPSAEALAEAVEAALAPGGRESTAITALWPAVSHRRRRRLGLMAGAAASALAMAAGAAWILGERDRSHVTLLPGARAAAQRQRPHTHNAPARGGGALTAQAASAVAPPATVEALEARGHALLAQGAYAQAAAVLRRAVATASPGSLTYAYALFDLGRALRLDGHPREAVAVLLRRLQIPNQTATVRAELALALQALGGPAPPLPPAPSAPGRGHHEHPGRGHGGGAPD